MKKYFKVTCKCGHAGTKRKYVVADFAVSAESGEEAAAKARWFPRVKHHHPDAILDCVEISYEEYEKLFDRVKNDEFLNCTNSQQQKLLDLDDRTFCDDYIINRDEKKCREKTIGGYYGKKEIRNVKRYLNYMDKDNVGNLCIL